MKHPVERAPDPASLAVAALLEAVASPEPSALAQRLRDGRTRVAIAFAEPDAGSDLAASRLHALRDGDVWVLEGQKKYIAGGADAEQWLVLARTDAEAPADRGFTAFLVPRDAPGVTSQAVPDLLGRHAFDKLFFEGVRVPLAARVGDEQRGWFLGERVREEWLAPATAQRLASLRAARRSPRSDDGGASRLRAAEVAVAVCTAEALLASGRARQAHLVAVAAAQRAWGGGGGLRDGLLAREGEGVPERAVDALAAGVALGPLEVHRNALARALGLP